ncbi:MAG: elongation factor G [Planctomycetaceae bacterium]|jgi:elongation factor G|nr:elongation factor G [Planctomycetaceae bacterium]
MSRSIKDLRNIGIIAHIDAGKTTVTERMLYYSDFVHKVGMVDQGTTVTDYDPEEQERGITIQAACVSFQWKGHGINLIDTPGHVDFTAEVERSLRVLDGGVVVFSAREGVEAQSEKVWRQADKYHIPRIAFINKMDREGADFYATVDEIRSRLHANPIVVSLPIGSGPPHFRDAFRGTIDLVTMKMLTFEVKSQGSVMAEQTIPEEFREECELWRSKLLDDISLYSDELTELLLSGEEVSAEMIRGVLRQATISDMAVPVFCGSALDGIGVQPVLDAVGHYLPSPLDVPPVEGIDPTRPDDPKLSRKPDPEEPFCALLFKIQADKHGDLHYLRIYSGTLKANSRVLNPREDKKENMPQLWRIQANRREQIPSVSAGDIVGVIGLRFSITGDTLCDVKSPILLETITFPETVISMAIEAESADEYKKLKSVLEMMKRQDPTFRAVENEETGQTLISGMGELHLEVIKHKILREYKVNVRVHNPRVSYRESIQKAVEITGSCHRTLGGKKLFAEVVMKFEPMDSENQAVEIVNMCEEELFLSQYKQAVMEAVREESLGGGSLGFPLINIRITLQGVRLNESETDETAFRIAVADAFRSALETAGVTLMEPIMKLEVLTPEEYLGDIVGDLQQRRAVITQTVQRGSLKVVEAEAPLANLFGYSTAMRGLSQGRAENSMEPLTYGPAPPEVLKSFMLG